jgi:uncharacterized protein YciW
MMPHLKFVSIDFGRRRWIVQYPETKATKPTDLSRRNTLRLAIGGLDAVDSQ